MNLKPAILKILILFYCTLWISDSITFGQNFVSDKKKFYVLRSSAYPNVGPLETFIYKFSGDTLINDIDYLKVFKTSDSLEIAWTIYGFIRETEDQEVYFRNLNNAEGLLYDFSAEINDTIYLINTSEFKVLDTIAIFVSDIDSIEINGNYKKKYILKTNIIGCEEGTEIWIEDIGNTAGPFINGALLAGLSGVMHSLLCVYNNQELIYSSTFYDSCYYNTVSIEAINSLSSITVYPNPVSSLSDIYLDISNINLNDCFIKVIDVYGKRVKIIDLHGKNIIKILRQDYAPGLYFLILRNDNKILATSKILIL